MEDAVGVLVEDGVGEGAFEGELVGDGVWDDDEVDDGEWDAVLVGELVAVPLFDGEFEVLRVEVAEAVEVAVLVGLIEVLAVGEFDGLTVPVDEEEGDEE